MNTPNDGAEPSLASAGSRPFAWAADIPGKFGGAPRVLFGYTEKLVQRIAAAGGNAVQPFPLYRQPQPTLTDEELKAIRRAAAVADEMHDSRLKAALGGLLERLG